MRGSYGHPNSRPVLGRFLAALVAAAVLVALMWFAWGAVSESLRAQGAESLRQSILDAAVQCAAIEGSYPASLSYLEDHYGVVANHEDYVITYEAFASNVMPSVVVVPR